jgi:hypothetical protein
MTSVKFVWKCLSAEHREVHQAHPDVNVVKGYVGAFLDEVDLLRGQKPKPCRYRGKFYDHALASHVVKDLKNLKWHDLGLAHFRTRSLEHNNRHLKALYSRVPAGGDTMHHVARIEIVWRRLFAMNRMLRRSCNKQMNTAERVRELLEAFPSDCEPNSDTGSETSIESGGSVPCNDSGEGCSVPDQFVTP